MGQVSGNKPNGALFRRRLLERLQLLGESGAGLEAMAAAATMIARDLVGADSGAIFWRDEQGEPAGFWHDCAPAELKDLFVTRFDELFSDPDDFNMVMLTRTDGPAIGRLVGPEVEARFVQSNVYHHLCAPLGHYHSLDMRIDHAGQGVGVIVLWNARGRPFTRAQMAALEPVRAILETALANRRPDVEWRSEGRRTAHFVTDLPGEDLLLIDGDAEALLVSSQLLRQGLPVGGEVRGAPGFARQLAAMLAAGVPAVMHLPVASGRIAARAARTRAVGGAQDQMFVALDREAACGILAAERVAALPLTFLQKRIALYAMQGGQRAACEARFGVSQEALKKHSRAIYEALGVSGWADLRDMLPA